MWLNIQFVLAKDTDWANKGHVIAWEQFKLQDNYSKGIFDTKKHIPSLNVKEDRKFINIEGYNFNFVFNKIKGQICSWNYEGVDLLGEGPKLNLWRAPIDNDMYVVKHWKEKGIHQIKHRIDNVETNIDETQVNINVKTFVSPPNGDWSIECEYIYKISGSGQVELSITGNQRVNFQNLFQGLGYR